MNLRKPVIEDYGFVYETLLDWPLTDRGPTTVDKAVSWTRRWMFRDDEVGLIAETSEPVGLVVYRRGGRRPIDVSHAVTVYYLAVHPAHRGNGHSNEIVRVLRDRLVADGVTAAVFDALPGPIAEHVRRGKYVDLGEVEGDTETLVRGRLTVDMDV